MNELNLICTINIKTPNISEELSLDIRQDLNLFLTSIDARLLEGPLDNIHKTGEIKTTFEVYPQVKELIENYFHLTAQYPKFYEATIAFNKIPAVNEYGVKGIFIP